MSEVLFGKPVAEEIYSEIRKHGGLKLVTVGFVSPQWQQYVEALKKSGAICGVTVESVFANESASPQEFCNLVQQISADSTVHGMLLQQPLPKGFECACNCVASEKDVDCLNLLSVAKLYKGENCLLPATPSAVLKLLDFYGVDLCGKNIVIVGRGNAVGKPLALACLKRNATVTVCHTKTVDLPSVCRRADILISACGVANLITEDFVTENTIVVDVGLSFVNGKSNGDVSESAAQKAKAYSPVPGGVGPVTRAALFLNLLNAAGV